LFFPLPQYRLFCCSGNRHYSTYYIDGAKVGESAVAPYVYNWDTTLYTDGSHTIQAKAYDAANNQGTSSTVTVSVNNNTNPAPMGSWSTITTTNQPVNNWTRMGSYYSSLTGKTYLVGGWNSSNSRYQQAVSVYDPATKTFSTMPDLPRGLERPFVIARSGYLYVMGGIYNNGTTYGGSNNTVYRISLSAPTAWETLSDAPRNISKSGFAVQGNIVYVYGGDFDGMLKFDLSSRVWTDVNQSSPRGFGAWYPSGFATPDGLVHFYGGRNQALNKTLYNDTVTFNPTTGEYNMTTIPAYGTPRDIAPAFVLNNKVYIVGGEINANVVTNTAETIVYDIGSGTGSRITDAPVVSRDHALGASGGNLLMFLQGQVYSLDPNGTPITPVDISNPVEVHITNDGFNQSYAGIDGQNIIWKDNSDGYDQIYLYNYTTGIKTKITNTTGAKGAPYIKGNLIVYTDSTAGLEGTYLYRIHDGSSTKIIDGTGARNFRISGDYMVYLA